MDGRPHPPDFDPHTWQGFSTGHWEGNVLVVETDHLKAGWIRRNGLALSDRAHMTERFFRHGDLLTHTYIIEDPVYLTEPLIKTNGFRLTTQRRDAAVSVSAGGGSRARTGRRAAPSARPESVSSASSRRSTTCRSRRRAAAPKPRCRSSRRSWRRQDESRAAGRRLALTALACIVVLAGGAAAQGRGGGSRAAAPRRRATCDRASCRATSG